MAGQVTRTTAEITALLPNGQELTTWKLTGVIPVRWSAPDFSTDSAKLALETFEIAHHGFLPG
jgi:phage tail-like protein